MDGSIGQSMIKFEKKEQFWSKGVTFKVYIDQKKVGNVGTNTSEEFPVEPGQHKVSIRIGWSKSNEIIVQSDFGKTSTLIYACNEPVINSLIIVGFMQFFTRNILKPFHLGIRMEERIDIYSFGIFALIVVISSILPSAMAYIKIIEPKEQNKE
ncbi:MAG TPA: hypothetical protein DDW65_18940 [Firmicutes bacterium]|jgi:hypothetical protein|nr:hypothetical protein [Bacillota bacterium]